MIRFTGKVASAVSGVTLLQMGGLARYDPWNVGTTQNEATNLEHTL